MDFPVHDMSTNIRVLLFRSHLVTDELVGQVIIPITEMLPQFGETWENIEIKSHREVFNWFELFPLSESQNRFKPAFKTVLFIVFFLQLS